MATAGLLVVLGLTPALRAGASGFVLKNVPPEQLVAGIRVIAEGESLLAPTATRR